MLDWDELILRLEKEWGKETIARWVRPLKVLRFDAANLYLEAETPLHRSWFEEHIRPRLAHFVNKNSRPVKVHLNLADLSVQRKASSTTSFAIEPDRVDPELTLEEFVTGEHNEFCKKLLAQIHGPPLFNPIFFFGPRGVGKTHLLTAAAHLLQKHQKRIFFVRAETFTSHVVNAMRFGQMDAFRKVYRTLDALLVDDIHLFARKEATQEEFFHTFNALHGAGKLIFLTASSPPGELQAIEPRLISRFEWGLSIGLARENPQAILEKKASLWKLPYPKEVLTTLAEKFPKNPLLALQALAMRAKTNATSITPEKACALLKDLLEKEELTAQKIIQTIASHFGLTPDDLTGKSQTKECAFPRQVAMYVCRKTLALPYQHIGALFKRDHSTVMASIRNIQEALQANEKRALDALSSFKGCGV